MQFFTAETVNWKRHFLKGTRITRPWRWITFKKKKQFLILKRPASIFPNKRNLIFVRAPLHSLTLLFDPPPLR